MEAKTTANRLKFTAKAYGFLVGFDGIFRPSSVVFLSYPLQGESVFLSLSKSLKSTKVHQPDYQSIFA
jgi:hypothetical protein